ncbi:MAG: OmpA family protein [Bacteroidales bacterium]|nr:OmpA family protein [Bacteroidales bacterium]MBN2820035.1 OmpA family protein [Bacteroidales bacterium]
MKPYILIYFLVILLTGNSFSQTKYTTNSSKAIKLYEEGRTNYQLFYHNIAEDQFLKAIKADKNFQEPYFLLGKLYWDTDRIEEAIGMYAVGIAINPEFYTYGFIYKGELELKIGRYSDALNSYKTLLEIEKSNLKLIKRANWGIERAEYGIEALKHPVEFKPVKLSNSVNSKLDEYWPSLSADEQTLVITRLDKVEGSKLNYQEDFYVSQKTDTGWTQAKNAGNPLNTYDNEGAQSISADGSFMVYTVCNRRDVIGRCDLFYSNKTGERWESPQNIGTPVNSTSKETQPGVSADGRTIYFASDRPGGLGGLDIWVTTKNPDGTWVKPVNLGDSINSPGDESSPFIHADNKTLYYSSNYLLGMGGFDIFYSRRNEKGYWLKSRNIGYPINTCRDEIGLIVNAKGNVAYYASDIDTSSGKDIYSFDIYKEARPNEVSYLKGKVFDASSRRVLAAEFELYNLSDGKLISKSESDKTTGSFLVCLPTNQDYMLNVSKKGYLFYSDNFSLEGISSIEKPFLKDVPLQAISQGGSIVLKNIFFETDAYLLKDESKYELQKLVRFLQDNPLLKVEISGHTDNIGGSDYNQQLSEKRAQSVVDFLINNGIRSERLIAKGYGMSKPIDNNDTEKGRGNNRRTEMTIIQ